ncbi:MAG: mitochondrial fission ELM1 family protein [Pseudomonadota bacterium]
MASDAEPSVTILCLTDGRAGNRAQALGLGEALARRATNRAPRPVVVREGQVRLKRWSTLLPARGWDWAARTVPGWPGAGLLDAAATLTAPGADLIIGAGRRAAPIVAHIGRMYDVPTVQLLDPQMDPAAFTLVAAPRHDGLEATNAVATLGSVGRVTRASIDAAHAALPSDLSDRLHAMPRPRIAVLLGGGSNSARWSDDDEDAFVAACKALADAGCSLIVTPSRRTDPAITAALRSDLPTERLFLWDGAGPNPYPGMLGMADAVLVTADSVNMASEAAASGLPVHVFPIGHLDAKLASFHRALEEHGAARPFTGAIESWTYAPLAEADRLAGIVSDRLPLGL